MKLEWSPLALADREVIFSFMVKKSPASAIAVDERIAASVRRLQLFPQIGRAGRVAGTRELVLENAPFVVAYRLGAETITVLRVLHSSKRWPDQLDRPDWPFSGASPYGAR